jgi:hypothetical protein
MNRQHFLDLVASESGGYEERMAYSTDGPPGQFVNRVMHDSALIVGKDQVEFVFVTADGPGSQCPLRLPKTEWSLQLGDPGCCHCCQKLPGQYQKAVTATSADSLKVPDRSKFSYGDFAAGAWKHASQCGRVWSERLGNGIPRS